MAAIFARKGISAEPQLAAQFKNSITHLSTLRGPAFDRAFKQQVISDHQQAIALFEQQAADGTDPDLRKFAERRLPRLRVHLAMAEELSVSAEADADET